MDIFSDTAALLRVFFEPDMTVWKLASVLDWVLDLEVIIVKDEIII